MELLERGRIPVLRQAIQLRAMPGRFLPGGTCSGGTFLPYRDAGYCAGVKNKCQ